MARIIVDDEICKGCGLCAASCPRNIIDFPHDIMNSKGYHPAKLINEDECIGCAMCAMMCPDCAIIVEK